MALPDEGQAHGALAGVVGDGVGHQRNVALLRDLLHALHELLALHGVLLLDAGKMLR